MKERPEAWESADNGREMLGVGRGRRVERGGTGGVDVPGSVLVLTSVSTVLLKSTTPSRLIGSLDPVIAIAGFWFDELPGVVRGTLFSRGGFIVEKAEWGIDAFLALVPVTELVRAVVKLVIDPERVAS